MAVQFLTELQESRDKSQRSLRGEAWSPEDAAPGCHLGLGQCRNLQDMEYDGRKLLVDPVTNRTWEILLLYSPSTPEGCCKNH